LRARSSARSASWAPASRVRVRRQLTRPGPLTDDPGHKPGRYPDVQASRLVHSHKCERRTGIAPQTQHRRSRGGPGIPPGSVRCFGHGPVATEPAANSVPASSAHTEPGEPWDKGRPDDERPAQVEWSSAGRPAGLSRPSRVTSRTLQGGLPTGPRPRTLRRPHSNQKPGLRSARADILPETSPANCAQFAFPGWSGRQESRPKRVFPINATRQRIDGEREGTGAGSHLCPANAVLGRQ
jgi:hypothetical protein